MSRAPANSGLMYVFLDQLTQGGFQGLQEQINYLTRFFFPRTVNCTSWPPETGFLYQGEMNEQFQVKVIIKYLHLFSFSFPKPQVPHVVVVVVVVAKKDLKLYGRY